MLGFLQGIIIKWFTNTMTSIATWFYKKVALYFKGREFVGETEDRVFKIEALQLKAQLEIRETGGVSAETREALRAASRDLVRGKRD